ncbi:MAG TPA: hypothetical protein PLH64_07875 [Anaerolineaceae bacterium]|nr:hypothetical protein [Anaerolineaceae bacterium]
MDDIINWLLAGDISIQFMTHRDLLGSDESTLSHLQSRIPTEGFGARLLACRTDTGHWGMHWYQKKWTSTHYTLLDLKNLSVPETLAPCREMVARMFEECALEDGGLNLAKSDLPSDVAVNGMILNYASYFCGSDPRVGRLADHLVGCQLADGGFNWDRAAQDGEPHATICVLEGLAQYQRSGADHRQDEVAEALTRGSAFLLSNHLFMYASDRRFSLLSYPYRYRFDLLHALEFLTDLGISLHPEMLPALEWLREKRKPDGLWQLEHVHKGNVHFEMEAVRQPSRFITLKALRILRNYGEE